MAENSIASSECREYAFSSFEVALLPLLPRKMSYSLKKNNNNNKFDHLPWHSEDRFVALAVWTATIDRIPILSFLSFLYDWPVRVISYWFEIYDNIKSTLSQMI